MEFIVKNLVGCDFYKMKAFRRLLMESEILFVLFLQLITAQVKRGSGSASKEINEKEEDRAISRRENSGHGTLEGDHGNSLAVQQKVSPLDGCSNQSLTLVSKSSTCRTLKSGEIGMDSREDEVLEHLLGQNSSCEILVTQGTANSEGLKILNEGEFLEKESNLFELTETLDVEGADDVGESPNGVTLGEGENQQRTREGEKATESGLAMADEESFRGD